MVDENDAKAKRILDENEERLRLVLDAVGDGSWDWDVQTGKAYYSDRWLESLGYERVDVPPDVSFWENLIHPDDVESVWACLSDHLEGRTKSFHCEYRMRLASGEYRWTLDRGRVVSRGPDDVALRMVGTNCEIHEQRVGELASRMPENRYQLIFESARSPILCVDENRCVIEFNGAAERLFGCPRETVLGKNFVTFLITEDRRGPVNELLSRVEQGEVTGEYQGPVVKPDGSRRMIVWTAAPITDAMGELLGTVAVGQDVTDFQEVEPPPETPRRFN